MIHTADNKALVTGDRLADEKHTCAHVVHAQMPGDTYNAQRGGGD